MKGRYFLDTNIILYSFDSSNKRKQKIAAGLIQNGLERRTGRVSFQVIQEFMNVAGKPDIMGMKTEDIILFSREILIPQCEMRTSFDLLLDALQIKFRTGYSFYDSLIIAAALIQECSILYSEDLHNSHKFNGLQIVDPFK